MSTADDDAGPRAFDVFCEYVASHAADLRTAVKEENQLLYAARDQLLNLEIYRCHRDAPDDVMYQGNIWSYTGEDETTGSFLYDLRSLAPFPHEDINNLAITVSGRNITKHGLLFFAENVLEINDEFAEEGVVVFTIEYKNAARLRGTMRDFAGSLEDVISMYESNQLSIYFGLIGAMMGAQPAHLFTDPQGIMQGCILQLDMVELPFGLVKPLQAIENLRDEETGNTLLSDGIKILASTCKNAHEKLDTVANSLNVIARKNLVLQGQRQRLDSIAVECPGVSLKLSLSSGRNACVSIGNQELPAWEVDAPPTVDLVPVSSLRTIRLRLFGQDIPPDPRVFFLQIDGPRDSRVWRLLLGYELTTCLIFEVDNDETAQAFEILEWVERGSFGDEGPGHDMFARLVSMKFCSGEVYEALKSMHIQSDLDRMADVFRW